LGEVDPTDNCWPFQTIGLAFDVHHSRPSALERGGQLIIEIKLGSPVITVPPHGADLLNSLSSHTVAALSAARRRRP
ncbi:MAG: hypothetical protein AAFP67_14760, partial [Pseudomonadota bacterium]